MSSIRSSRHDHADEIRHFVDTEPEWWNRSRQDSGRSVIKITMGSTLLTVRATALATALVVVTGGPAVGVSSIQNSNLRPSAATQLWGGTGTNDLGPATVLVSARNGRVTLRSVQFIMSCTDTSDGTDSARAFDYVRGTATLNRNRFAMTLRGDSNGRSGAARLTGVLGSNGRGTARIDANARGIDPETGQVIENCQATVTFALRRGAAS